MTQDIDVPNHIQQASSGIMSQLYALSTSISLLHNKCRKNEDKSNKDQPLDIDLLSNFLDNMQASVDNFYRVFGDIIGTGGRENQKTIPSLFWG